jgi:hypothetical protein
MNILRLTRQSALLALACVPVALSKVAMGADTPSIPSIKETRLFSDPDCVLGHPETRDRLHAEVAAPLAAAAIQVLVDTGIGFASSALDNIGQPSTKTVNTATNVNFFSYNTDKRLLKLDSHWKCLLIIRGRFGMIGAAAHGNFDDYWAGDAVHKIVAEQHLVATPELVLEVATQLSIDTGKFDIEPVFFEVNKNQDWSLFTGKRDFVFSFTFSDPAITDSTKSGFALGVISFSNIQYPARFKDEELYGKTTGWLNLPALGGNSKAALDAYNTFEDNKKQANANRKKWADSDQAALDKLNAKAGWSANQVALQNEIYDLKLKVDKKANAAALAGDLKDGSDAEKKLANGVAYLEPVNITVQLAETRDGNAFIASIAKALKDSITANKTSVESALTGSLTGTTAEQAHAAGLTAQQAALTAYSTYLSKLDAFNTATGSSAKKQAYYALQSAVLDFDDKARTARKTAPAGIIPSDPVMPAAP